MALSLAHVVDRSAIEVRHIVRSKNTVGKRSAVDLALFVSGFSAFGKVRLTDITATVMNACLARSFIFCVK